jgi:hypothetical protein
LFPVGVCIPDAMSTTTFVPRRSPRLAALAAAREAQQNGFSVTVYSADGLSVPQFVHECNSLLRAIECPESSSAFYTVRNHNMLTQLLFNHICNYGRETLATHPQFHNVVRQKANEMRQLAREMHHEAENWERILARLEPLLHATAAAAAPV